MPPARSCTKCKSSTAAEGDSWCTGCTSWEFIGRELGGSWDSAGARVIANDLVVNTARQIRALRGLGAGLARSAAGEPPAGSRRAREEIPREPSRDRRESLPRRRSGVPPPPASSAKEEELSEDLEGEEETEEEEASPDFSSLGGGHHRPPEPEGPPPAREKERKKEPSRGRDRGEGKERERDRDRGRHHKKRKTSGGRRGGRKHQRLYRLATDPNLLVHRKPGRDFWELQSGRRETLESDRLGH